MDTVIVHCYNVGDVNVCDFLQLRGGGGVNVSPDGSLVILWTDANLSALTGVPDTNDVSDLFAWDPIADKVRALSVNNTNDRHGRWPNSWKSDGCSRHFL